MFAGHLLVNSSCPAYLFSWLVKAQNQRPDAPVVLWLNGGPGSSSMIGWFFEHLSPFTIVDSGRVAENPLAWSRSVDIVMLDQPAGVGLGFVGEPSCYPTNLGQSTRQMAAALSALFANPELGLGGKKLFLFGESYAGTYLPLLGQELLSNYPGISVGGLGVGDGWVNPELQQATYALYAEVHGLISGTQVQKVDALYGACLEAIRNSVSPIPANVDALCATVEGFIVDGSGANPLDVRRLGDYDLGFIGGYLNQPGVARALHVDPRALPWEASNEDLAALFETGEQDSYAETFGWLFKRDVPVLVFNGVYDMDCNFLGTDSWLAALRSWPQAAAFAALPRTPWRVNGTTAGMWRGLGPVTQLVLYGAGHMVPYDVPAVAREMMEQFVLDHGLH